MSSNFSVEELIKYRFDSLSKDQILQCLEDLQTQISTLEDEVKGIRRSEELISEQAFFGRELVTEIQAIVSRETRAKEMKKDIERAIADSYFET